MAPPGLTRPGASWRVGWAVPGRSGTGGAHFQGFRVEDVDRDGEPLAPGERLEKILSDGATVLGGRRFQQHVELVVEQLLQMPAGGVVERQDLGHQGLRDGRVRGSDPLVSFHGAAGATRPHATLPVPNVAGRARAVKRDREHETERHQSRPARSATHAHRGPSP